MNQLARITCSAAFICVGVTAVAQDSWAVLPEQATCLIENLEQYREADQPLVVIFVKVCPLVDRLEAMQALQQNSGVPHVTVAPDGTALDEVIVYSRQEIDCLARLSLDLAVSPVLLPKKPCVR